MNEEYILNHRIKAKKLRVIDDEGNNLGVMSTEEALKEAQKKEFDLLVVSPNVDPPVAKIVDFSKFLYEERKKKSAAKIKSKKVEIKELRLTPTTGEGDLRRFADRTQEFMEDGNKVKISVVMRGRQQAFPEVAYDKLKRVEDLTAEYAKIEIPPKHVGNTVWMLLCQR